MPDPLIVETNGEVVLGEKQAQYFALSICASVKAYIQTHRQEYEEWARELEAST